MIEKHLQVLQNTNKDKKPHYRYRCTEEDRTVCRSPTPKPSISVCEVLCVAKKEVVLAGHCTAGLCSRMPCFPMNMHLINIMNYVSPH